ncbi:hypothetical protein [Melissospora conviva]|uniref:hypothetical protein n=1 Tax=Melissospora conviva TaxID=3388432 RepID=UPI003B77661A
MVAGEQVPGTAQTEIRFGHSSVRTFLTTLLILAPGAWLAILLADTFSGVPTGSVEWIRGAVLRALFWSLIFGIARTFHERARSSRIAVGATGIELAWRGAEPVLLSWSQLAAARVRRPGPLAVLEITPVDRDSVEPFAAQQRLPRLGADGTLRVPVGELKPGPNVLRDAIAGRPGR